jgi:hypothetical protein
LALGVRIAYPPFEDPEIGPGFRDPQHELRAFDIRRDYRRLDRQGLRYSAQDMHHALDELQQEGLLGLGGWKYEGRPFVQADRGLGLIGELNSGAPECPDAHAVSGADGIVETRRLRARHARALDHDRPLYGDDPGHPRLAALGVYPASGAKERDQDRSP